MHGNTCGRDSYTLRISGSQQRESRQRPPDDPCSHGRFRPPHLGLNSTIGPDEKAAGGLTPYQYQFRLRPRKRMRKTLVVTVWVGVRMAVNYAGRMAVAVGVNQICPLQQRHVVQDFSGRTFRHHLACL